jgi:hypothetical protein
VCIKLHLKELNAKDNHLAMNLPCQSNNGEITYGGRSFYSSNVICRMYKRSDLFVKHNICKDSRDRFVEGMHIIGTSKRNAPVLGIDFQFFKKKGNKDERTFDVCGDHLKTAVVAYSGDWIEKTIVDSNLLSMDALEIVLLREMEYELPKDCTVDTKNICEDRL